MSSSAEQTEKDGDQTGRNSDGQPMRKYTSFLTLNRYNKIYTQEFKEEDIEIMNINSKLKELNTTLEKIVLTQVLLVVTGFFLFIIDTELFFKYRPIYHHYIYGDDNNEYPEGTNIYYICSALRCIQSAICLAEVILAIEYYLRRARISRIRKIFPVNFPIILEDFLFIQSVTSIFMQFKFFIIIRFIAFKSPLNSAKGRFIVALRGIDYTSAFLVKVWLTMNPFKGLIMAVSFLILLNSYLVLLNERTILIDVIPCYQIDRVNSAQEYRDALWMTMVTFLTVGYGDIYPTTFLGRYIQIITAMGGQLYIALVIGLIHGQLMLTSEESGVLNIISNNKKEKNKRYVAATLIYYILKMAGSRNKLLAKGQIHWYKTRDVANMKFELYVNVMRFKKIKNELANYYSTRGNDTTLGIIKNTENQLALLATEVIKIFDIMKDSKLERKKNINESYIKKRSMLNKIIEQEASIGQRVKPQASRIRSDGTFAVKNTPDSSVMYQNDNEMPRVLLNTQSNQSRRQSIRASKTLNPNLTKFSIGDKPWNKKKVDFIEEESESSDSLSEDHNHRKRPKLNSYATNFGLPITEKFSLSNRLQERKNQQKIQQQLTNITHSNVSHNNQIPHVSPRQSVQALSKWRNITSNESLRALSYDDVEIQQPFQQKKTSFPGKSSFGGRESISAIKEGTQGNGDSSSLSSPDFFDKQKTIKWKDNAHQTIHEGESDQKSSLKDEESQELSSSTQKKSNQQNQEKQQQQDEEDLDQMKLPLQTFSKTLNTKSDNLLTISTLQKDQSTSPISEAVDSKQQKPSSTQLKRLRSQEVNATPHRKTSIFKDSTRTPGFKSSASRRSSMYQKSNTQVIDNKQLQKQLSIRTAAAAGKLKQQKTQLHPTLVSIIEEEETYSDEEMQEDHDFQLYNNDGEDPMYQIEEEDSSYNDRSLSEDTINEDEQQETVYAVTDPNAQREEEAKNSHGENRKGSGSQNNSQNRKSQVQNEQVFDHKRISSTSSLGQVFDEYRFKQDTAKSLHILNRIYENYSINTRQKMPQQKSSFNISTDQIALDESPQLKYKHNSSTSNSGRTKPKMPSSDSFYISEDQYTNSVKSNSKSPTKPPKTPLVIDYKKQNTLTVATKKRKPNIQHHINQVAIEPSNNLQITQQDSEMGLSPIFPFTQRKDKQPLFQLELKQLQEPSPKQNISEEIIEKKSPLERRLQYQQKDSLFTEDFEKRTQSMPYIDLAGLLEKAQSSPALNRNQKQSILSFQDQLNQLILQQHQWTSNLQQNNDHKISGSTMSLFEQSNQLNNSPRNSQFSEIMRLLYSQSNMAERIKKMEYIQQRDLLKDDIKSEDKLVTDLIDRIHGTESLVQKALSEARQKIQKLKAAQSMMLPTLQVNVINNNLIPIQDSRGIITYIPQSSNPTTTTTNTVNIQQHKQ